MRVGTENKKELVLALILAVVALYFILRAFSGSPATTATTTTDTTQTAKGGKDTGVLARNLDPTLRLDLLKSSSDVRYTGKGRNIFESQAEIPKPVEDPRRPKPNPTPQPQPYTPPPPPPINLKFFGFANHNGEQPSVFLSEGDNVFIAKQGDIVNRRYRVVRITPRSIEVEDVLNNNRQTIPISQG